MHVKFLVEQSAARFDKPTPPALKMQMVAGIVPTSLLECTYKVVNAFNLPNWLGIVPVREL